MTAAVELQPRPYPQLLRGPRHRWWRPFVGLAVMVGLLLVLFVLSSIAVLVVLVTGDVDLLSMTGEISPELLASPALFTVNNLFLASLVPAAMLAVWAGHGWRPRWVASVVPGIRWRWMLGVTAVCLLVQVAGTLLLWTVDGFPTGTADDQAVALLLCVLLTTPLQCAGEEYLCRGWLTQAIGSFFSRALLAVLVPAVVTAAVFAGMHSLGAEQNLALFLDRFAFGLLASYLVWRTGGLEAAIAAHTANNLVVMVPAILTGTLDDSLAVSDAPWGMVALDVVVMVVVGVLVTVLARFVRAQRVHDPARQPGAPPPPLPPPQAPPGWGPHWPTAGPPAGPPAAPSTPGGSVLDGPGPTR
ncbi:hypothetical protein GCM10028777_29570 [Angustibacter speluncae]